MNTNQKNKMLSDTELNQLLQHASKPQSSADFETRLLEKLSTADFSSKCHYISACAKHTTLDYGCATCSIIGVGYLAWDK